jgi:hypothetical protein
VSLRFIPFRSSRMLAYYIYQAMAISFINASEEIDCSDVGSLAARSLDTGLRKGAILFWIANIKLPHWIQFNKAPAHLNAERADTPRAVYSKVRSYHMGNLRRLLSTPSLTRLTLILIDVTIFSSPVQCVIACSLLLSLHWRGGGR